MSTEGKPLAGKVCLITGGTFGIGRATALAIAAQGATVVAVGRQDRRSRGGAPGAATSGADASIHFMQADLSVQQSVRELAERFLGAYDRLDILINNAGGMYRQRQETADGLEMTLAVNYLAPFMLTRLLLGRLQQAGSARIVNVASKLHAKGVIDFADLQGQQRYDWIKAYNQSKLGNVLFTYELARRLSGRGVTVNSLHPGVVASGMARNNGPLIGLGLRLVAPFLLGVEEGAKTSVFVATSPRLAATTAKYFDRSAECRSSPASYDEGLARRLWDETLKLVRGPLPDA